MVEPEDAWEEVLVGEICVLFMLREETPVSVAVLESELLLVCDEVENKRDESVSEEMLDSDVWDDTELSIVLLVRFVLLAESRLLLVVEKLVPVSDDTELSAVLLVTLVPLSELRLLLDIEELVTV